MAQVAYIRVSTIEQNTDRQLQGMSHINLDKIYEEKVSAKTIDRPIWNQCLDYVREGDVLHIYSLDRVCRSGAQDAVNIVETLNKKGVGVVFHKEGMTFNGSMTAAQKGVLSILASVAQMERDLIRERQREGQQAAKARGKHIGRKSSGVTKAQIQELKERDIQMPEVAKLLGISRATAYNIMKRP